MNKKLFKFAMFFIISIFRVIFGQNLGFWPPGAPIYRVPLNCYEVDYEDIASRFTLNVFSGYFVLSNGPTGKILIECQNFGVIFTKILVFHPLGRSFIGPPSTAMQLIMKILHQSLF